MTVFSNVTKEQAAFLLKQGFSMVAPKTIYEDLRLVKGGVSLILFTSGKLMVQGKDAENIVELLRKKHIGEEQEKEVFRKESGWMIGTDESLKGDTFGGIVVAGVKANDLGREKLKELGVADSKKLADTELIPMAIAIKKIAVCEIKSIMPEEYNARSKHLTLLLDTLHHGVAQDLGGGKHVVDKYPGCTVGDIAVTKAESKYLEVAAASILARAAALEQLDYLSKQAGFNLPKGSTHVKDAMQEAKNRGLDFRKFAKLHFKNVAEFLQNA